MEFKPRLASLLLLFSLLSAAASADDEIQPLCLDTQLATTGVTMTSDVFAKITDKHRFSAACKWFKKSIHPRLDSYEGALQYLQRAMPARLETGCITAQYAAEFREVKSCATRANPTCRRIYPLEIFHCAAGESEKQCRESALHSLNRDPLREEPAQIDDFNINGAICAQSGFVKPRPLVALYEKLTPVVTDYPRFARTVEQVCASGLPQNSDRVARAKEAILPSLEQLATQSCKHETMLGSAAQTIDETRGKNPPQAISALNATPSAKATLLQIE